ncbi:hypothetical protein E2C01_089308 [Portunus trituberculatus]|uniref:Uncharacterized protein n=1 Tax=Portunus trituberculatus TaxID=210409 RepID=A0A5B7JP81_PORTR|nr:hypothetical protein [Portunus trituberculatus]
MVPLYHGGPLIPLTSCVCSPPPRSPAGHTASLLHYGASSKLIDRSSERTQTSY